MRRTITTGFEGEDHDGCLPSQQFASNAKEKIVDNLQTLLTGLSQLPNAKNPENQRAWQFSDKIEGSHLVVQRGGREISSACQFNLSLVSIHTPGLTPSLHDASNTWSRTLPGERQ